MTKRTLKNPIKYKLQLNEEQKLVKEDIYSNQIVVVTGQAGSGKSLVCAQTCLDLLFKKEVDKVFVTRATIEVGKSLGLLPGEIADKYNAYIEAFKDNLYKSYDKTKVDKHLDNGQIVGHPVQYIRGKTVDANQILVVEECFSKDTGIKIRLNGEKEISSVMNKILFYYRNNLKVEVLSYNHATDTTEYKNINSIRLGKTRKWVNIYNNYRDYPLTCTDNHPIATIRDNGEIEYVPAKSLTVGDSFVKRQSEGKIKHNIINYNNLDILCGFLLGDGSLSKNKQEIDCARVCKNHGLDQKDYMLFCMSLFKNAKESKVRSGFTGEPICGFTSKSYNIPKKIRNCFYKGKNKQISSDIEEYITERTLSLWYMDDGNLGKSDRITLHTEGFNKASINNLLDVLYNKFSIKGDIYTYKKEYNSKDAYYHVIKINKENSKKYFNLIRGLVHPNLKYKVPDEFWEDFDKSRYNKFKNLYSVYSGIIRDITITELEEEEVTYNFEVEGNANYFADDTLAHNCQNLTKHEMLAILTRLGKGGKIIINGDLEQSDIKDSYTGLHYAIDLAKNIEEIQWHKLKTNHRSDLVGKILDFEHKKY